MKSFVSENSQFAPLCVGCRVIDNDVIIIDHGVGDIVAPLLLRHRERRSLYKKKHVKAE